MKMNETKIQSSWRHETSSRVRDSSLVKLQAMVGRIVAGGILCFILKFHIRFRLVISVHTSSSETRPFKSQ